MSKYQFYIVDVFAENKYEGNQLAVILNAHRLSDREMQMIAKEMNYSETTFILSGEQRNKGYDVRIFTPEDEIPFAGHPTLGTAFIIKQFIHDETAQFVLDKADDTVILNLKAGQIPVTVKNSDNANNNIEPILWMDQIEPEFGRIYDPDMISLILNVETKEIDERFPIQSVSTGLPFVIVPLKSLDSLKRARINLEKYYENAVPQGAGAFLIFCPETYHPKNDLNDRVFAECYGVAEDPATGSANGCLAGYLVKHRYFQNQAIDIRVEQGYEIGRPSLLYLKSEEKRGKIDVHVGGKVILIAGGKLV
jgi:trans-2,3-dihydro-3-hydroxyanthranilate isomerase